MKKLFILALVMVLSLGVLAGCGGSDDPNGNGDDNGNGNGNGEEVTYTYTNGTFAAFSDDSRGWVKVEITINNDEITAMNIWEYSNMGAQKDYETYGTAADGNYPVGTLEATHEAMIEAVVEANNASVDIVTGSTSTSNKTIQAVERAMESALVTATSSNTYFNGKFGGAERGERGAVIALVTIANDVITEVEINETAIRDEGESFKDEDYGNATFTGEFLMEVHADLAEAFVAANGADIDIITGATSTSNGAIEAVKAALENATR